MSNRNNRNRSGNRSWKNRNKNKSNSRHFVDEKFVFEPIKVPEIHCPYCDQLIDNINTAISLPNVENPVHFDCVLKKIESEEELGQDEYVSYLGKGAFGIIRPTKDSPGFFIRKRIQVEDEEEVALWRTKISKRMDLSSEDFSRLDSQKSDLEAVEAE